MCVSVGPVRDIRSIEQNNAYWGVWLDTIEQCSDHPAAVWHELFKKLFIKPELVEIQGHVVEMEKSTTKLTKKEFSEYIDHIHRYAAQVLKIVLPPLLDKRFG